MKQEQIHIRVSEVEKAQLLKLAGNEKLSRYLLRRGLEDSVVQGQTYVELVMAYNALMRKVREKQKTDVYTSEETDDEIRIVREPCEECKSSDHFRYCKPLRREVCTICYKGEW